VDHARRLIARHFSGSGAELCMGGVAVGDVVAQHGTPVFVYDRQVLEATWARLRSTYPSSFSIAYSVKANPNPAILRHFVAKGAPLEVASAGELARALAAGCAAEHVLFAGPGKTERELELALSRCIGEIHVESALEARRIGAIARRRQIRARVALRVNPRAEVQGGAMRMGGKPAPFGVDEESSDEVIDFLESDPGIDFRGLHLFAGTQILDPSVLVAQYRHGVELARRVATRLGRPLATLDFGGGLGVPYFAQERELDLDKLGEELHGLAAELEGDPRLAGTRLLIEPGRFLVAEAGVYVTRIIDIKVSRGKTFYILDGGMNHHLAASGNLGQVIKRNFPIAVVSRLEAVPTQKVDVVGPLCTPLDTLARDVDLARAEVGDLVGIFQSGAYGLTASPQGFLSHPRPAEVLVGDGRAALIQARREREDGCE
jgi:diaminopimelate decarboxylase